MAVSPLSLVLNTNFITCWDLVTFQSPFSLFQKFWVMSRERASKTSNYEVEKGFLFKIINRNFIWREIFVVSLFKNHL